MKKIEELDKNFLVNENIRTENVKVYDIFEEPFKTYGYANLDEGGFSRIPKDIAKTVNQGVYYMRANPAGVRIRFATDSKYIAIYVKVGSVGRSSHYPLTGSAGFDLFAEVDGVQKYIKTFIPKYDVKDILTAEIITGDVGMREYTINFPFGGNITDMNIILDETAVVKAPRPYKISKPVVFYGSSITHGYCASRPGNVYSSMLSRKYDFDFINLGFSGCAKGEKEMAEYIASLDMSVLVYDYDHNAPTAEYLKETHYPFYKIIREKHPNLPIICMTRPYPNYAPDDKRPKTILETVEKAQSEGDKNIYFVNTCQEIVDMGIANDCTVDGCHPNDLGFYGMARALEKVLDKIL